MKLMIVDDHAPIRALIRELIGHLATEVRECASGEEAIVACATFTPDIITMDLRMKKLSGLEAAKLIHTRHPQSKFVMVSHFADPQIRADAERAGASGFVAKDNLVSLPVVIGALLAAG